MQAGIDGVVQDVRVLQHLGAVPTRSDGDRLDASVSRSAVEREIALICDLNGLSHAQKFQRLRLPLRTLQTRLYRGRDRLRVQPIRRAVTTTTVCEGLAAALRGTARASISATSSDTTAQAAARVAEGYWPFATRLVARRVIVWARAAARGWIFRAAAGAMALAIAGPSVGGAVALANKAGGDPQEMRATVKLAAISPLPISQPADRAPAARPIAQPLPGPDDLQRTLTEVAHQATRLAREKPRPGSRMLARVAQTQARAGDRAGAAITFNAAVDEACGAGTKQASARGLWLVGQAQAEVGLVAEARSTFRKAATAIPKCTGDFAKDHWTLVNLKDLIKHQTRVGDRQHARENRRLLDDLVSEVLKASKIGNAGAILLPELAGAQAATADFDGAFATVERLRSGGPRLEYAVGSALGRIADGTEYLKPLEARRFIRRAAAEMSQLKDPVRTYSCLSDLAEAQARHGDYKAARQSALAIGERKVSPPYDMTDGQPYALLRVAIEQKKAGDLAGARETLRLGYESVRKHSKMRGPSDRLSQIAGAQLFVGDLEGALRSAEAIDRGEKSEILAQVAWAQAVIGQPEQARETMLKALDDASLAPADGRAIRPSVTFDQDRRLARLQATAGYVDTALETTRSIEDPLCRKMGLAAIVESLAAAGDPLKALDLARSLEAADDRREALEYLAAGLSIRMELESVSHQRGSQPVEN